MTQIPAHSSAQQHRPRVMKMTLTLAIACLSLTCGNGKEVGGTGLSRNLQIGFQPSCGCHSSTSRSRLRASSRTN